MVAPLQRNETAPASFLQAAHPGYLGNPDVVASLLGDFLAGCEADLAALARHQLGPAAFQEKARDRIKALSHKMSGEHPGYPGIEGWHGPSLRGSVRGVLGPFMAKNGAKWGDDPVACMLEWVLVRFAESWKNADGDDDLLSTAVRPDLETVRDLLTGAAHGVS